MSRRVWISLAAIFAVAVVIFGAKYYRASQAEAPTLNVLAWTGYEEPEFVDAFQKATGIKVNIKTYVGGDQMYSIFSTSHGAYDAVIVDPEYIASLHKIGKLAPIDRSKLDFGGYHKYFQHFPLAEIDGQTYAVPVRFGANGIVYNTTKFSAADVQSYSVLFSSKAAGHVGIWDWYLPSMGVLSKASGFADAYNLTDAQYGQLTRTLARLRPQVAAIHPTPPDMVAALGSGRTWILPAGGEWVAAVLQAQGKPIDWDVPKEGGIMWVETVTIPSDAPHPNLGLKYLQWLMTAKAQALLSQRNAYHSNEPNQGAYSYLTQTQRHQLKAESAAQVEQLIAKLSLRQLPIRQDPRIWQDTWQAFKSNSLH